MAKKITIIIVSIVVVLAVAFGVYYFGFSDNKIVTDNAEPTQVLTAEDEYLDEDMSLEESFVDDSIDEFSDETTVQFVPNDELISDNTNDIVTTDFSISRIIDHTTDQEVKPRVVFGSNYNDEDNYIVFDSNGSFEISFSGYFNNKKTGTYSKHDDYIYVEYSDGTGAEYEIQYNEQGIISYIIVNYGDYDIYFS